LSVGYDRQEVSLEAVLGTAAQGYQMGSYKMAENASECVLELYHRRMDYTLRLRSVALFSRRHLLDPLYRQGCPQAGAAPPVSAVGPGCPPADRRYPEIVRIERLPDDERHRMGMDEYYPGYDGIRVLTDEHWELDVVFGQALVWRETWEYDDEDDEDDDDGEGL